MSSDMSSVRDISAMTDLAVKAVIDENDELWLLMPSGTWITMWRQTWFYLTNDVWHEYAPLPPVPPPIGYNPVALPWKSA